MAKGLRIIIIKPLIIIIKYYLEIINLKMVYLSPNWHQLANLGRLIQLINVINKNEMSGRWDILIGLFSENDISGVLLSEDIPEALSL